MSMFIKQIDHQKIEEANVIPLLREYREYMGEVFTPFDYGRYPYGADDWINDLRNAVEELRSAKK